MSKRKIASASILVAGTAIGAGMLALPVSSAEGGFFPAVLMYLFCWGFSTATGLLLLEACLWFPKDANIVTLSKHLLGKKGKWAAWLLYLFFFYCLTVAYLAGGGESVMAAASHSIGQPLAILLFFALFAPIVYLGTKAVDRCNLILMGGLIITFALFLFIGFANVELSHLTQFNMPAALLSLPVLLASFSYQGIVPSIRTYFAEDPKGARKVIIIGSSIPFFIYLIWEFLILGIVPLEGADGLLAALAKGQTAIAPLRELSGSALVYPIGQAFAFFALTTSFLGVSLGFVDFLADGLKRKKEGASHLFLSACVYLPPLIVALVKPNIFISALSYAGGFGAILLLGLLPILMVWSGRYRKGLAISKIGLGGGKALLLLLILFVLFEISTQIAGLL